jgi:hypothetical protein
MSHMTSLMVDFVAVIARGRVAIFNFRFASLTFKVSPNEQQINSILWSSVVSFIANLFRNTAWLRQ